MNAHLLTEDNTYTEEGAREPKLSRVLLKGKEKLKFGGIEVEEVYGSRDQTRGDTERNSGICIFGSLECLAKY